MNSNKRQHLGEERAFDFVTEPIGKFRKTDQRLVWLRYVWMENNGNEMRLKGDAGNKVSGLF